MWPLSLKAGERGDAPLTQHTETKFRVSNWDFFFFEFYLKAQFTCPFVFDATAAPSAGFSTAASPFPVVLEICAPMLSVQTKEPNRSNE